MRKPLVPVAGSYPAKVLQLKKGEISVSYCITDACINCGACEPECPNTAISAGDDIFLINPDKCTDCVGAFPASRCEEVCPVDACHPDPNHPETREQLLAKWRNLHPGEEPAPGSY